MPPLIEAKRILGKLLSRGWARLHMKGTYRVQAVRRMFERGIAEAEVHVA